MKSGVGCHLTVTWGERVILHQLVGDGPQRHHGAEEAAAAGVVPQQMLAGLGPASAGVDLQAVDDHPLRLAGEPEVVARLVGHPLGAPVRWRQRAALSRGAFVRLRIDQESVVREELGLLVVTADQEVEGEVELGLVMQFLGEGLVGGVVDGRDGAVAVGVERGETGHQEGIDPELVPRRGRCQLPVLVGPVHVERGGIIVDAVK